MLAQPNIFADHAIPNSTREILSTEDFIRLKKERVTAQHKSVKDAVYATTACDVKAKELKMKAAIKEKERTTSETVENQSEPASREASELKNEDEDLLLDGDSSRSTQLNTDAMTIGEDGNEGLDLTSE